jgi:hypothetical protein
MNGMKTRQYALVCFLMLASGLVAACRAEPSGLLSPTQLVPTAASPPVSRLLPAPTATYPRPSPIAPVVTATPLASVPAQPAPTATHPPASPTPPSPTTSHPPVSPTPRTPTTVRPPAASGLGTGLRQETAPILVKYAEHAALVMSANPDLSELYFPQLEGWVRVLGAPSLDVLQRRAERAAESGLPYEALGYGLETGKSTPEEEWRDVVGSTQKARAMADQYGKLLVMGPGFRLMSQNWDSYPAMAALADVWILQTQRLQANPPGPAYRQKVEEVVEQIRSGNPNILIWAQITLPPDREPSVEYWVPYHQSIADLVAGTYVGAYTWQQTEPDKLVGVIDDIFAAVCGEDR